MNKRNGLSTYNKWKYTLYTSFIFLFVVNPVITEQLVKYFKDVWFVFVLQIVIFTILLRISME